MAPITLGLSWQRSRPVPRRVVLDVLERSSPGAVDRAGDVPTLWKVGTASRSFWVTVPQIQVHFSGFCPGHEILVLVRPVVPYTQALSSKRSRPVVSPAVRFTSSLFCRRVASQAFTAGWLFVLALLSYANRSDFKRPQKHKTRLSPTDALYTSETID